MVDNKLHPRLHEPVQNHLLDTQGFERPRELLDHIEENLTPLLSRRASSTASNWCNWRDSPPVTKPSRS